MAQSGFTGGKALWGDAPPYNILFGEESDIARQRVTTRVVIYETRRNFVYVYNSSELHFVSRL